NPGGRALPSSFVLRPSYFSEECQVVSLRTNNGVGRTIDPPALAAEPDSRAWPAEQTGLYRSSEVRILVLDDDEAVCRVIQAALAPNDFKVELVSDPARMQEALQQQPYHLIILDYVLPGLETEQVLNWIHEFQSQASIVV